MQGLAEDLALFQGDPEAARKYVNFGTTKSVATLPAAELAAYALSANVLLNLDEVVTRE
jgi:hypothetical protein